VTHLTIEPSILYFGTPVALIATRNEDGSANLAPISSAWALGYSVVLGLGAEGQTAANLERTRECTVNLPDAGLWRAVERLAPLTGRSPVPAHKRGTFRFEREKFGAAGLTPQRSQTVAAPRVRECPLQLEARLVASSPLRSGALATEVEVTRVHASPSIVIDGTSHVDVERWRPLLYVFRHYFGASDHLGKTFRAEA
jgi:flavin reductase (DIM6/NTAB) family NADH-FMN oxidoreductase RutF